MQEEILKFMMDQAEIRSWLKILAKMTAVIKHRTTHYTPNLEKQPDFVSGNSKVNIQGKVGDICSAVLREMLLTQEHLSPVILFS